VRVEGVTATRATEDEQRADADGDPNELLLLLVLREGGELPLVLLLLLHRTKARLVLRVVAGLLDLALANRLEACRFLPGALPLLAAALVLRANARLFRLARAALGVHPRLLLGEFLLLTIVVFLPNTVLLQVHQLLEGEENGGLFLFRHSRLEYFL